MGAINTTNFNEYGKTVQKEVNEQTVQVNNNKSYTKI